MPQVDNADHSVARCEEFAQHFAGRIAQVLSDLDAAADPSPSNVTVPPACPVLMNEFPFLQSNGLVRTLEN